MKYIFDFDDVLFNNTEQFKKHMYECLENAGVSSHIAVEYYKKVRHEFSLRNFLTHFGKEHIYEKIMSKCPDFLNTELLEIIKKRGKENCYMITHGEKEYQLDKIKKTGIAPLFSEIIVIQGSKKEAVEGVCAKHKGEEVIFIDDRADRFADLDFKKCPNLKTILYTGQNLEPYLQ
jgi:FMN phosphatase YigB (HAD superfamily)